MKRRLFKLVVKHLEKSGVRKYIHKFGPKKFQTSQLVLGLVLREKYKMTYRDTSEFLQEYYDLKMHWTTLQKACNRLPLCLWQKLLQSTIPEFCFLAAIDGTGYSRTNPSAHYLRRIDGKTPSIPIKLSIMIDVDTRKVLSARIRTKPRHEILDVPSLIRQSKIKPWTVLMDKGYDSQPLHEYLDKQGIWSVSPTRKGCAHGRHRKLLHDKFPEHIYNQRNVIESVFKTLKTKYLGHVHAHTARTCRAAIFIRLFLHNLRLSISRIIRLFLQSP